MPRGAQIKCLFLGLSENVLERDQYLNCWARKKDVSSAVQTGFSQSAEGLHTRKKQEDTIVLFLLVDPSRNMVFFCSWTRSSTSGSWFSNSASELYHQLHSISSSCTTREGTSLPQYYMIQLFIIFIFFYLLLVLLLQRILTEEHVSQNGKVENETM